MSVGAYIENLTLADAAPTREGRIVTKGGPGLGKKPPQLPTNLQAAVDAGSVLSFVSGVSDSEKRDVLFTVQLAQRAANAAFDRFAQTRSWYGKYNEVLEAVGWTAEQFAFAAHNQAAGDIQMDKAALSVIAAIATGNQLQAITASLAALEKLAENDGAITLFDFSAATDLSGNFQIGAVQKASGNGALAMAVGAFYFRAAEHRRKFLFFKWGSNAVNFWTAAQKMTFNVTIYDRLRASVEEKLGQGSTGYIHELKVV